MINPVSHDDLRRVEERLGERIDKERDDRIAADSQLRNDVMGEVRTLHSQNQIKLDKIDDTTRKTDQVLAEMRGALKGGGSVLDRAAKFGGWALATALALYVALHGH